MARAGRDPLLGRCIVKRLLAFVALAFIATASNCGTGPQPVPTPSPDAAAPPSCVTVCQRGAVLGCTWAVATPASASCADVCANALAFGMPWDLVCRTNAQTCAAVNLCQ